MKRTLYFRNTKTGETDGHVDVTGHAETRVERIMRGMLINIGDDWIVCDSRDDADAALT